MQATDSNTTDEEPLICPHCDAKQLGPATNCWLCHQPLSAAANSPAMPPPVAIGEPPPERFSFSLATMFLLMTLAAVSMGLLVAVPGLGILACLVMVPVVIRTIKVVRHRESVGHDVAPAQKVVLFLTSFAAASVISVVACIAAFCSFCGVCASVIAMSGSGGEAAPIAAIMIPVAAVSIFGLVALIRWRIRCYRREINRE